MHIVEVNTPGHEKMFLEVPLVIYKNDPNWIRPLDKDVLDVFDEKKNKAFRFGKLVRWVLLDDQQKPAGRIAAFINKKYKNKGDDVPVGGVGFFESVNNQEVAFLLLDSARSWLKAEGMEAMDGPINFGERDRWWGMVTKGFIEPMYCMNYNPPYYVDLFKAYGFRPFFEQVCFDMLPKAPLDKKIWSRHDAIANDPAFHASHILKKQLEKFAGDFATVTIRPGQDTGG